MHTPRELWAPTPLKCTFLNRQEFQEREEARRANVQEHRARRPDVDYKDIWTDELRAEQRAIFPAGLMWEAPWLFEDDEKRDLERMLTAAQAADYNGFLSVHYLRDWAKIRPPLVVVCPDYQPWVIDSKSSNGSGWTVTGSAPDITASPSIWTHMGSAAAYHGFLQGGSFTPPC